MDLERIVLSIPPIELLIAHEAAHIVRAVLVRSKVEASLRQCLRVGDERVGMRPDEA